MEANSVDRLLKTRLAKMLIPEAAAEYDKKNHSTGKSMKVTAICHVPWFCLFGFSVCFCFFGSSVTAEEGEESERDEE